jgi:hypothetical protein
VEKQIPQPVDSLPRSTLSFQLARKASDGEEKGRVYTKDSDEKPKFIKVMIGK